MADTTRDTGGVPEELEEREDTGVILAGERITPAEKIRTLFERYKELRKTTATKEDLRREVTGARESIEKHADEHFADAKLFDELKSTVDGIKPPGFWKIAAGLAGFFLTVILAVGGIVWSASARISDLALQSTIVKIQLDGLNETVKRLEAAQQATQSKVDQLLIHGAKP